MQDQENTRDKVKLTSTREQRPFLLQVLFTRVYLYYTLLWAGTIKNLDSKPHIMDLKEN